MLKQSWLIAIVLLLLPACGPKVSVAPTSGERLRTLVLLPPNYDVSVARERLDYINDTFAKKLSTHGFNVISGQSVKVLCADAKCSDVPGLAAKSKADAIAQILVSNTTSANVLAGYFQSISGTGLFLNNSGKEIAKVDYTQTERGGLLFNSGQVLQGIKSTVDKFGDDSFNNLADKFLETIVSKLPAPNGTLEVTNLDFGKSSLTPLGSGRYLACVQSSNANSASLRNGKTTIPLRSSGPGKFCGGFLLDPSDSASGKSQWMANITGRYGESKSIALEHAPSQDCQAEEAILKESEKIVLSKAASGCSGVNFLVFEAKESAGPYALKGKLQKPGTSYSLAGKESSTVAVVGVSDKLGTSKPLLLK